jgi:hypothetical protein
MKNENYLYLYQSPLIEDSYDMYTYFSYGYYNRVSPLTFISVKRNIPVKNLDHYFKYFVWSI